METRLIIAYSIIAVLLVTGAAASIVVSRRRAQRRRRLRGIKTDEIARTRRRQQA